MLDIFIWGAAIYTALIGQESNNQVQRRQPAEYETGELRGEYDDLTAGEIEERLDRW